MKIVVTGPPGSGKTLFSNTKILLDYPLFDETFPNLNLVSDFIVTTQTVDYLLHHQCVFRPDMIISLYKTDNSLLGYFCKPYIFVSTSILNIDGTYKNLPLYYIPLDELVASYKESKLVQG